MMHKKLFPAYHRSLTSRVIRFAANGPDEQPVSADIPENTKNTVALNLKDLVIEALQKPGTKEDLTKTLSNLFNKDAQFGEVLIASEKIRGRISALPSLQQSQHGEVQKLLAQIPNDTKGLIRFATEHGLFTPDEIYAAGLRAGASTSTEKVRNDMPYKPRPRMSYDSATKTITWPDGTTMSMDQYRAMSKERFRQRELSARPAYDKNLQIMKQFNRVRGGSGELARDYFDRKANMEKYAGVPLGYSGVRENDATFMGQIERSGARAGVPYLNSTGRYAYLDNPIARTRLDNGRATDASAQYDRYARRADAGLYKNMNPLQFNDGTDARIFYGSDARRADVPRSQLNDELRVNTVSSTSSPAAGVERGRVAKTWTANSVEEKRTIDPRTRLERNPTLRTIGTPDWFKPLYSDRKNQDAIKENAVVRPGDPWPSLPTTFVNGIYEVPSPNTLEGEIPKPFVNESGWHMPPGRFDLNGMTEEQQRYTISRLQNPYSNQEEALSLRRAGRGASKSPEAYEEPVTVSPIKKPYDEPPVLSGVQDTMPVMSAAPTAKPAPSVEPKVESTSDTASDVVIPTTEELNGKNENEKVEIISSLLEKMGTKPLVQQEVERALQLVRSLTMTAPENRLLLRSRERMLNTVLNEMSGGTSAYLEQNMSPSSASAATETPENPAPTETRKGSTFDIDE